MYVVTPVHRTSSSKQVEVIEMKNRLLFALVLTTIIAALITGLAITFLATRQVSSSQESPLVGGFVPLYELAEKITLDKLINISNTYGLTLYLPTKMPGNIKLVAIYYKPPVILLSYSDREVMDYRYDNISVEISAWPCTPPSLDELNFSVKNSTGSKVFNINSARGILIEQAPWGDPELQKLYGPSPFAYFWIEDHYYMISATPPINGSQLLEIIRSMRPLKG